MLQVMYEMLSEQSLTQLTTSTISGFLRTKKRQKSTNKVRITSRSFARIDTDKLLATAQCDGETDDYVTKIEFDGVEFVDVADPDGIKISGDLSVNQLDKDVTDVRVSCTCLDFHWTFAWYNSAEGTLIGDPPPPYTPSGNRPPRNPSKVPGLCKHLLKFSEVLKSEGLI